MFPRVTAVQHFSATRRRNYAHHLAAYLAHMTTKQEESCHVVATAEGVILLVTGFPVSVAGWWACQLVARGWLARLHV